MTTQEPEHNPSFERGCLGKINLGRRYVKQANLFARRFDTQYGVYRCPHCGGTHLTTKLGKRYIYSEPLLYITPEPTNAPPKGREKVSCALRRCQAMTGTILKIQPDELGNHLRKRNRNTSLVRWMDQAELDDQ